MSRCFPYPPPGYCRNGASYEALIESIKLQKDTNNAKAERKKERRAKKEKEKRQKERNDEDEIKLQKKTKTNDDYHKLTNAATEPFEKSDLTEENGPSVISSQQPSYSSDSTQNSNKRNRGDASLLPDSSSSHGKPIKIRFLKKHKGSDSSNFDADAKSNTYLSVLPPSFNLDGSLVPRVRKNINFITSGRESRTQEQSISTLEGKKITDSNGVLFGREQSAPSSVKPVLQSTRPQQPALSSFGRQFLHRTDDQGLCSGRQPLLCPSHTQILNSVSNKTSNEITISANDCSSHKKQKEDAQKGGPTKFEKKMMKKHAKYEKLMGSLFPPVFQAHLPSGADDDDEDWLSRTKATNPSLSKGEVERCRESVASWHPCARFLADVDMHVLPYTIPF